jgi:hypothetical protein
MSDLALGQVLRRAIEQQRQGLHGQIDPRRLESQLAGWVNTEQQALLPALSFLLRSALLRRSLEQSPSSPLLEAARAALLQEMGRVYSPAVCQRLDLVLQGLLPGASTAPTPPSPASSGPTTADTWAQPQATATAQPDRAPATVGPAPATSPQGASRGLGLVVALLCFLVGGLGAALALLIWLQRAPGPASVPGAGSTAGPVDGAAATLNPTPPAAPPVVVEQPDTPAAAASDVVGAAAAIASVEQLYGALSARDYSTARSLFGPVAADQFDPAFFAQFSRVSVSDLRELNSNGSEVQLEGTVRFDYPDGSVQLESRSFTVDTTTQPALITASAFGQVLQPR